MRVHLAYGQDRLPVELPDACTTVIEPVQALAIADEKQAVLKALVNPIQCRPLAQWLRPDSRVCITFTDKTRATPNHRLIPWLLEYLEPLVARDRITLINSLGTHRPNSRTELETMLSPEIMSKYRVVDNEPDNPAAHMVVGKNRQGQPALISRHFMEADVRLVTGFIEPHFFAGFSGGPKGIMPGVACLQTVMGNHCPRHMDHPMAAFGITEGNPIWEEMRDIALMTGPCFLLNVTLNTERKITGVFAGDLLAAHRQGTEFVRRSAMREVDGLFDIVVTTNSGYPLDLNLYQGVKGMCAGARIVKPGGLLILACECRDGVPDGSPYEQILHSGKSPEEILQRMLHASEVKSEQWQAQIQAIIQRKAEVLLYSSLPDNVVRSCHLRSCKDISTTVAQRLEKLGPSGRVAVLPEGPLTIPYLKKA
jgi:nickel-dependent lactate racemase